MANREQVNHICVFYKKQAEGTLQAVLTRSSIISANLMGQPRASLSYLRVLIWSTCTSNHNLEHAYLTAGFGSFLGGPFSRTYRMALHRHDSRSVWFRLSVQVSFQTRFHLPFLASWFETRLALCIGIKRLRR